MINNCCMSEMRTVDIYRQFLMLTVSWATIGSFPSITRFRHTPQWIWVVKMSQVETDHSQLMQMSGMHGALPSCLCMLLWPSS
jgi:hypothetical protein